MSSRIRFRFCYSLAWTVLLSAGCVNLPLPFPPFTSRPAGRDFATAPLLDLDADGNARIQGNVGPGIVDVWDLGPMSAGDRVHLSVLTAIGSLLDPTAAFFDANRDLFAVNDDRVGGGLDSFIDEAVREDTPHFYMAITASFYSSRSGDYLADLHVERGGPAPVPAKQKVLLYFGAVNNIHIDNVGNFTFNAFDGAQINPVYSGKTSEIKAGIVTAFRQNYVRFNVEALLSDDGWPADGTDYSTIYFGGFSNTVFGISSEVDTWNANACDDGIIYTDSFDTAFAIQPSAAQIALAIGNVAAHEAGHLLGLSHTADVTDLMDTTGSASTLLLDQEFKRAILDRSIFPFGYQNSANHLVLVVGNAP